MRLTTKYNLILISVLLSSLVIIGATSYYILQRHAREEVIKQAAVLMEAALAMRKYTITEIKPLLALQNKRGFLPQSVPSYAATKNFESLRTTLSEYSYKEATLNPTNPRDRAADWESDIIQQFRNNAGMENITLVRSTPLGEMLYYARPIEVKNEGCLTCHGMVSDAPQTMIDLYGPANGFGWKMNEVVGSQIISVPLSLPVQRANETFFVLMSIVAGVFLVLYFMLVFFFKKLFLDQALTLNTAVDYASVGERISERGYAATAEPLSQRERIADRIHVVAEEPVSQSERNSERRYAAQAEPVSQRERISERRYATQDEPISQRELISERKHSTHDRHIRSDDEFQGFNVTHSDATTQAMESNMDEDVAEVRSAIHGLTTAHSQDDSQEDDAFNGFDITRGADATQALNTDEHRSVSSEYSLHFDPAGASEASDPRTILLEEMYKKQGKAPSILDDAYDVDDVVTDLSTKETEVSEKT